MPKQKAKPRDRSKENRITVAVALHKDVNTDLQQYSKDTALSVSWCVNKAVKDWLKTVSASAQ